MQKCPLGRRPKGHITKKAAIAACIFGEEITFSCGIPLFWKRPCSMPDPR